MPFALQSFTLRLIEEALFYDDEYGIRGTLSLVQPDDALEMYVAYFDPEEGVFAIDAGVAWEPMTDEEKVFPGYAFASDTKEHATVPSAGEAATMLLELAEAEGLLPSLSLVIEEDDLG